MSSEIRTRCHKDGLKKYPWILGNVSKDKSQSIQGYLTKYHGFMSFPDFTGSSVI